MLAKPHYQYIAWALFLGLLLLQWAWCRFVAYPISFERNLKKGKSWVYIPIKWKGNYKFRILLFSRLLMLGVIATGMLLASLYTGKAPAWTLFAYGLALGIAILKLNSLWLALGYRQQEDAYYFLHDELRVKLENEGKDIADAAFRSLAAYQHQNILRKADEQGELIRILRKQSHESRQKKRQVRARQPVET